MRQLRLILSAVFFAWLLTRRGAIESRRHGDRQSGRRHHRLCANAAPAHAARRDRQSAAVCPQPFRGTASNHQCPARLGWQLSRPDLYGEIPVRATRKSPVSHWWPYRLRARQRRRAERPGRPFSLHRGTHAEAIAIGRRPFGKGGGAAAVATNGPASAPGSTGAPASSSAPSLARPSAAVSPPPSGTAAAAATPAAKLHQTPFPDGSGSIGLPDGWTITAAHAGEVIAKGPEPAGLHFDWPIRRPRSPVARLEERRRCQPCRHSVRHRCGHYVQVGSNAALPEAGQGAADHRHRRHEAPEPAGEPGSGQYWRDRRSKPELDP